MNKVLRIGQIGAGSFGAKRAAAIKECPNATLVGVADDDSERALKVAHNLGVESLSVEALLAKSDAVAISAPPFAHADLAIRTLEAGKHVLCEKPLATTSKEALRIVAAARNAAKFVKVGSNHRFFASVSEAQRLIREGVIGRPFLFTGAIGVHNERLKDTWHWHKELSGGGALLDNGHHLIDLAHLFLGADFVSATGWIATIHWPNCQVEDSAAVILTTSDYRTATLTCSWRRCCGYMTIEVLGTEGSLVIGDSTSIHRDILKWASHRRRFVHTIEFDMHTPNSLVLEVEAFANNILAGTPPSPSAEDGAKILELVESIYQSETGQIENLSCPESQQRRFTPAL